MDEGLTDSPFSPAVLVVTLDSAKDLPVRDSNGSNLQRISNVAKPGNKGLT